MTQTPNPKRDASTVHRHDPVRLHEFGRIEDRLHKMHKLLNGEDKLPPWVCAALYVLDKDDPLNAEVMERGRIRGKEIWDQLQAAKGS